MKKLILIVLTLLISSNAFADKPATVSFENLKDGQKVNSPFKVKMLVHGMKVKPAGELVAGTGHHHLIINGGPVPMGTVVKKDDTHIHFGAGQTETTLELPKGNHTLTLQFADGAHRSYGPELSKTISIEVN